MGWSEVGRVDVGIVRERKVEEGRVALTPQAVRALTEAGHRVLVERGAGLGAGYPDEEYDRAGAVLLGTPEEVAGSCQLLVKVKEPQPEEYRLLRPGLVLFCYLHLAPQPGLTQALLESRTIAIAYETVQAADGSLPLLRPMSLIAGRLAGEVAAQHLRRPGPGRGKLLGGIEGAEAARCIVLGAGNAGSRAALTLDALQGQVTVLDRDPARLRRLQELSDGRIAIRLLDGESLMEEVVGADVLVCAILVPGALTPRLLTREAVRSLGPGAVLVDISIDQGGACETSRPTTLTDPTYVEEGVVHYCVTNMPGAVPRTATQALSAAVLPYVLRLASEGLEALRHDPALARGVNTFDGHLTIRPVAEAQGLPYTPLEKVLP